MKKVAIVFALALVLILGCSRPGNNPVSSNEIWWQAPDAEARWFELSDFCSYRVPVTQDAADSICNERGYHRSSGYEVDHCYVGGERRSVLSRVACSSD